VECKAKAGNEGIRLECHHIQPIHAGGSHKLDNLEMRCVQCHRKVHREWRVKHEQESGTDLGSNKKAA
jgi:hypothetical protein